MYICTYALERTSVILNTNMKFYCLAGSLWACRSQVECRSFPTHTGGY